MLVSKTMAKNSANVKETALSIDTAIIVKDFASRYQDGANKDAMAAVLRHCQNKETFNVIRVKATAALLVSKGYDAKLASAIMDGSMTYPNATIGKKPKRTVEQEKDYKNANASWSHYLTLNGVASLNAEKARVAKRAPRQTTGKPDASIKVVSTAPAPLAASIAPEAVIVTRNAKLDETMHAAGVFIAGLGKVAHINDHVLKGDKGAALRAFIASTVKEFARINSLQD